MNGGFLGTGKTTRLLRLGQWLTSHGRRVGLVTNDEAGGLVDTALGRTNDLAIDVIAGGPCCCRSNPLLEAAEALEREPAADILLAQPVGSCTELVAMVSLRLEQLHGERFELPSFRLEWTISRPMTTASAKHKAHMTLSKSKAADFWNDHTQPHGVACHSSKVVTVLTAIVAAIAATQWPPACIAESDDVSVLPNVIVMLADDLGYGDLSAYRRGATKTRACERLAREGMRFTDAHSASSVCSPTRYSLLTGRYPWRSYLQDWVLSERMPLLIEEGVPTLPGMLRRSGYRTACVGKWHLGFGRDMNAYQRGDLSTGPLACGFDECFIVPFSHNSSPEMEVFVQNDSIVGMPSGHSVWDPIGLTAARRSLENTAGDLSRAAVHFIEQNRERPFFLYYATTNVHFPITPHVSFRMRGRGDTPEGRYAAFVSEFDWAVDQILRTLDRLNLTDSTMVVVTSDNGGAGSFGGNNEPLAGDKGEIMEGGHRVPMIVRYPKLVPAGTTANQPVVLNDLYATCAELVGQSLADDEAIDSHSLMSLLSRTDQPPYEARPIVHHSIAGVFAVRDGPWKWVEGIGSGKTPFAISLKDDKAIVRRTVDGRYQPFSFGPERPAANPGEPTSQLFHLEEDPTEATNLADAYPERVEAMKKTLQQIRKKRRR